MRLPLPGLLVALLSMLATLSASAQTTPATLLQPPASLQNQLIVRADGTVTFDAADAGKGEHEMVLFKSDKDPASLPISKGNVDESAIGQKVGEIEGLRSGDDKSATFDVKPGKYILICNLVNHYNKG